MKLISLFRASALALPLFLAILAGQPQPAAAHCDTMEGPVVQAAERALAAKSVTPVMKWIQPHDEQEIRAAFHRTLTIGSLCPESKDLVERYFFETLVRLHRAGEGAPYMGLKSGAEVDPAVLLADKALAGGSPDELIKTLMEAAAFGINERFLRAAASRKKADESIEAGRQFVADYIEFTHYVERLHQDIAGQAAHQEAAGPAAHHEERH